MTCKDCIHEAICDEYCETLSLCQPTSCGMFKDKSLIVELPCKVGDSVWIVDIYHNYVEKYTVGEIDMWENGDIIVTEFNVYNYSALIKRRGFTVNYFGKTVFLTREEAEKALKEREKE